MKKILSLVLSTAIIFTGLVGCGATTNQQGGVTEKKKML